LAAEQEKKRGEFRALIISLLGIIGDSTIVGERRRSAEMFGSFG
jgi:hypothetical protein